MTHRDDEDESREERRAQGVVERLHREVTDVFISVARLQGKIETIGVQIDANAEQRDRMETTLKDISASLRELNGRTRKSEDAIAELRHGHSAFMQELSRTLAVQPDGGVLLTLPVRPPMTAKQKAGVTAIAVPLVLGGIDMLRQGFELAIEWLKHGAGK